MPPELQGPWLRTAATTDCPGCGHIVDAERAACEWCDTPLNGEPGPNEDDPQPGSATRSATATLSAPLQAALPTFLLAQSLRPIEPTGPAPLAPVLPDQLGTANDPPTPLTVVPATPVSLSPLTLEPLTPGPGGIGGLVTPVTPGGIGGPVTPVTPLGLPAGPIGIRPNPVAGFPAYSLPSPVRTAGPGAPRHAGPALGLTGAGRAIAAPVTPGTEGARLPLPGLLSAPGGTLGQPKLLGALAPLAAPPAQVTQTVPRLTQLAALQPTPAPLPSLTPMPGPQGAAPGISGPGPQGEPVAPAPPALAEPVVRPGTGYGVNVRPSIWPNGPSGRVSGPGG